MAPELDDYGRSELHYAAADGDVERVGELVHEGADPSLPDKKGWTPLHFAAQTRSAAVAQVLLEAGATVDAQDSHGDSPLFRAIFCSAGDVSVIELLQRAGADPWLVNHHGQTPAGLVRLMTNDALHRHFADLPAEPPT